MMKKISKSIGQNIIEIIKSQNPHAFSEWEAKNISQAGKNIKFNVGKSEILVLLVDKGTFNIKIKEKNKKGRMIVKKKISDIPESALVESIGEIIQ